MSLSKHVLFLMYDGLCDPLGQSQVLPYLIGLRTKGYRISIISFEKKNSFELTSPTIHAICKKHTINWFFGYYRKKPPILSTVFGMMEMYSFLKNLI